MIRPLRDGNVHYTTARCTGGIHDEVELENLTRECSARLQILISKGIDRKLCASLRAVVTTARGILLLEIGDLLQA